MCNLTERQKNNKSLYGNYIFSKNGINYVRPISNNLKSFRILCPYCFMIHRHGAKHGHRVSHCKSTEKNNGYVIVPNFDSETIEKYEQLMRKHYD